MILSRCIARVDISTWHRVTIEESNMDSNIKVKPMRPKLREIYRLTCTDSICVVEQGVQHRDLLGMYDFDEHAHAVTHIQAPIVMPEDRL